MYDLAVIGLGPAGLEAVNIATKNKLSVVAFEKMELGGTCLNLGCIPIKSILHTSNVVQTMNNSSELGISLFTKPDINWQKIIQRNFSIITRFTKALNTNLSKNITLVKAEAELFVHDDEIDIYADDNIYQARNIIVATGSKPINLNGLERDGNFILNSNDMFLLDKLPRTIAIVGSGAVGLEWAKALSDLGVVVFLIEKASSLAPGFDVDIQKRIERIIKTDKVNYYKDDHITSIKDSVVFLNSGSRFAVEKILVAVGRTPVMPKINIAGCTEEFKLKSYEDYTTDFDNIFVAGDANGECMLAHAGAYQAKIIMNKILNNNPIPKKTMPSVIYLTPEVASIGLREQDINKDDYIIKKIPMAAIAKSWCDNCYDGLIKIIIKDDKIKGAHIVSKDASLLISLFSVFIDKEISVNEIKDFIFPHPSLAEAISEALRIE